MYKPLISQLQPITDEDLAKLDPIKYRYLTAGGWLYNKGSTRHDSWGLFPEKQGVLKATTLVEIYIDEMVYEFTVMVDKIGKVYGEMKW